MAIKKSELYSSLWASCDELRGGMDASQYKDYVLVLLFIKYVSDKYAGQPYAPITIPKGASFKDMAALKGKSDIGDQINKKIIAPLANANKLSDMPDFNDVNKLGSGKEMVDRLTNLIAIFENKALDFSEHEPQRAALYKATVALVRAYANIADDLEPAGYGSSDISRIRTQIDHYLNVREIIRKASGETLDLKAYEADMRHLIDTYIEAAEPRKISPFDNMGLLELIVKTGIADAIARQLGGLKGNRNAIAETIENNIRSKIIKEHLNDPAFYEKMSTQLQEIIELRKAKAIEYEEYLKRIAELAKKVGAGHAEDIPDQLKNSPALRALYNNLNVTGGLTVKTGLAAETAADWMSAEDPVLSLTLKIDEVVKTTRPDGWRGVQAREQVIKAALYNILQDVAEVERIFLIVKAQGEY